MLTSHQIYIFIFVVFAGLILTLPLETMQVLIWITTHLFELLEIIYELLEFILDEAIHHVFHTSRHATQVIVFYLMAGLFLYGLHRAVKSAGGVYRKHSVMIPKACKQKATVFFNRFSPDKRTRLIFGCTFFGVALLSVAVF